jgi:iron complex outermembrane receptor protein
VVLAASNAAAEDVDPFALSPEELFDAEVVSASRSAESVWEAAAAISVVTSADIERSGATSIPEALRLVPGVQVARINTSAWAISVRGFNSPLANKLLVLIDGREIYDPLFSGVYWDVQDTALEDIDRIEVIRGPGASLWGANAVNGVINIITKSAAETQGALVSAIAGNVERGTVTARYGGIFSDDAHWRIYGRAFERDDQETLSGADDQSHWSALRGGFRVDASPTTRQTLTIQGDLYHSETGQFRRVPSFTAPFMALESETIVAEGGNVLGRWSREGEDGGRLTAQAYLDMTRRRQRTLEDQRTTFDLDVQYEFPTFGAHDLIAGVRYRYTADDITETDVIRSNHGTNREQLLSTFVQDQITLSPAWRLTLGAKIDDTEYTGIEVQPNARLQWAGDDQMVWSAVSRAVRTPSELDREFNILLAAGAFMGGPIPATIEIFPSPRFESEEVVAYELGYRRQWNENVTMDVALFHNEYSGLATLTPLNLQVALDPLRVIFIPIVVTNRTNAYTDGVEVALNWRAQENLNLSLAYSFLDMELHAPSRAIDGDVAEGRSPSNQATLRAQWDATDRLALDATLYYVDELPDYQINAYTRTDARVAYRLTDQLQFELIGQGLFDEDHREFTDPSDVNAAAIGRSIFGRLTWRS